MRLVVDTNVAVSAIVRNSTSRELLFHPALELYSPAFMFEELREHEPEVSRKAGISVQEFNGLLAALGKVIKALPSAAFLSFISDAKTIVADPDDLPFVAAAIALMTRAGALDEPDVVGAVLRDGVDLAGADLQNVDECGIWSNDTHITGRAPELLKRFGIKVWTTRELYRLMTQ
ncbi:MAG: PIN domain-containing protein [Candidatus Micrarchaeota archaeon]